MIAVCLLTCGRYDLTLKTVWSFLEHNKDRADLIQLHADADGRTPAIATFETIDAPCERVGQMVSFRRLIEEAAKRGAEFVLWLENDWVSVARIPCIDWLRICRDRSGIVTWRMFGVRKMRGDGPRAPAGEHRIGTNEKVGWSDCKNGWQFGLTHWGAGGCIATLDYLKTQLHHKRLKEVITANNRLPTMRPKENIMYSIGEETTEGFQG